VHTGRRGLRAQDAHPAGRGQGDRRLVDEPSAGGQRFEIAGPQEELLPDLARQLIEAEGRPVEIEAVVDPVDGERHEQGALLPGPDARLVGPTFADWLAAR